MFLGEYRHNIDAKNRIIIPAKYRDELGETFILTRGTDKCLSIYTLEQWEEMFKKIAELPESKKVIRKYRHSLTSKASECTLDSQGRIKIPEYLKKIADIKKECVISGEYSYITIWDTEEYDIYDEEATMEHSDISENITEFKEL